MPAQQQALCVSDKAKTTSFIENIVLTKGQNSLSLKITLTIDLTMSLVGALTFSSLFSMMLIQNFTTMVSSLAQVVMGVALVGRMVLKLYAIRHCCIEKVI